MTSSGYGCIIDRCVEPLRGLFACEFRTNRSLFVFSSLAAKLFAELIQLLVFFGGFHPPGTRRIDDCRQRRRFAYVSLLRRQGCAIFRRQGCTIFRCTVPGGSSGTKPSPSRLLRVVDGISPI